MTDKKDWPQWLRDAETVDAVVDVVDGRVIKGMCLVFERGELHPTLKTVTRLESKSNQYEAEQRENNDAA